MVELVRFTNLDQVSQSKCDIITDFVKRCSFEFKTWIEVGQHQLFHETEGLMHLITNSDSTADQISSEEVKDDDNEEME